MNTSDVRTTRGEKERKGKGYHDSNLRRYKNKLP